MADDKHEGAVTGEDSFEDANEAETVKASELNRKVQTLEQEKFELVQETNQIKEKLESLTVEVEEWKKKDAESKVKVEEMAKEIEKVEEGKRAKESIQKRCAELEYDVVSMHHKLINALNNTAEATAEIAELKTANKEKGDQIESLIKEIEEIKNASGGDNETRVKDLEKKIGNLEINEIDNKNKKLRTEEEMRDRVSDKDRKIDVLKRKVEELESVMIASGGDAERWVKEKCSLEEKFKNAKGKAKNVEQKILELLTLVEEAGKTINGMKEKACDGVNGKLSRGIGDGDGKGWKLQWPVLAIGSTGVIVTAAVLVCSRCLHVKRR